MENAPVLFAGGSGVVGRAALRWFRDRNPDVPTIVGGRDLAKAEDAARRLGARGAVAIDLDRPGIGLEREVSGIIALAPDSTLNGLRHAQDLGVPYVSGGTWLTEAGGEMALFAHRPTVPVLVASHWWGGSALFLALRAARDLDVIHALRLGALVDDQDETGPAAIADMARSDSSTAVLAVERHRRVWLSPDDARSRVTALDGRILDAVAYAPFDIASLHAATPAAGIRFSLATGTSSSRRAGGPLAAEIVVEVEGEVDGRPASSRSTLEFVGGQASLTGLGIALSLPALLGLDGHPPAPPGILLPELLAEPEAFLAQLTAAGATIRMHSPASGSTPG